MFELNISLGCLLFPVNIHEFLEVLSEDRKVSYLGKARLIRMKIMNIELQILKIYD